MIFKTKYRKIVFDFMIKILCFLIITELIFVSFGFCGHLHEQWSDLSQVHENESKFITNHINDDLHSHSNTHQHSDKQNHSHCHFRCPCNGGFTGVFNIFAFQTNHPHRLFFMHDPHWHEFFLILPIFHPPVQLDTPPFNFNAYF